MAVGLAFGASKVLADRYLFAGAVPAAQADMVTSLTAPHRILPNAIGAAIDEVVNRLVIMTALVWSIATINGAIRGWCYWAAIVAVAFVAYPLGHLPYLASLTPTA